LLHKRSVSILLGRSANPRTHAQHSFLRRIIYIMEIERQRQRSEEEEEDPRPPPSRPRLPLTADGGGGGGGTRTGRQQRGNKKRTWLSAFFVSPLIVLALGAAWTVFETAKTIVAVGNDNNDPKTASTRQQQQQQHVKAANRFQDKVEGESLSSNRTALHHRHQTNGSNGGDGSSISRCDEVRQRPPPDQQYRNYTTNPVTAEESRLLSDCESAENRNIKAAVCHPTLYGNVSMHRVCGYVSYYRLLGFDHVFLWYESSVLRQPGGVSADELAKLESLPYVTATLNDRSPDEKNKYRDQGVVMKLCRSDPRYAASYDWIFVGDVDEYLYLGIGGGGGGSSSWIGKKTTSYATNVKDFIRSYPQIEYFSFGKWLYTMIHAVPPRPSSPGGGEPIADSGFDLDRYAFTAKSYCWGVSPGKTEREYSYCPTWKGRCKVLAKQSREVDLHGDNGALYRYPRTSKHFDTSVAHIKEWNAMFWNAARGSSPPRMHERGTNFEISDEAEVLTWGATQAHPKNANGNTVFYHDEELDGWFRYVASGCGRLYNPYSPD